MSEELTKQIGRQLQTRRWQLGMSQMELSDKCGVSDVAIGRIENLKNRPNDQTLDLLAEALDCDFEFKLVPRK